VQIKQAVQYPVKDDKFKILQPLQLVPALLLLVLSVQDAQLLPVQLEQDDSFKVIVAEKEAG